MTILEQPLFIVYSRWVRVMLLGLLGYEGYQRFKNTLMGTGSQGKIWRQNNDPQMTGIMPI